MSNERIESFIKWLDEQENLKGWTDNKLAVRAGISPSVLTRARQGSMPKWEACVAIASALNISPVIVFHKAGLISDDNDPWAENMNHRVSKLSGVRRSIAEKLIDALSEEEQNETSRQPNHSQP